MRSFMICTPHQILLGWSSQGGLDIQGRSENLGIGERILK
jgi:hypothetical protein